MSKNKRSTFKLVLIVIVLVLLAVIVLQNTETMETSILFLKVSMPRAVLLFVTLLVGFVAGLLFGAHNRSRKAKEG